MPKINTAKKQMNTEEENHHATDAEWVPEAEKSLYWEKTHICKDKKIVVKYTVQHNN